MKRTISAKVGRGSVNHNTRKFHAKNTDPERSHLNITYCEENIKAVYHELFDEALARYNSKQTRADRKIKDYYEKIRASKQEKTFHEIILQVGNKDDMHTGSDEGSLAVEILEEYMTGFRERNPQLRVFSAHLQTRPHRICILILFHLQPAASAAWKRGYLSNRRWLHRDFKAEVEAIQSGINGYAQKKINFRL